MNTRTVVLTGVAVVAIGAGAVVVSNLRSSDEAPIRVRNGGSMDITAGVDRKFVQEPNGDHEDNNPSYSYEPTGIDLDPFDKDLYVKAVFTTGTCTGGSNRASGRRVEVEYRLDSGGTFTANFKRAKSGPLHVNRRTKVRPRQGLDLDGPETTLRHAPAGFVSRVTVDNQWNCSFNNAQNLTEIVICSSQHRQECQ